ncbi:MAG: hypothetical protein JW993_07555 [Sedimentisphaerales bacterium]|nr:hypothetical protein [Sedimentisphaerales bacterium]
MTPTEQLLRAERSREGMWLFLGATDTGKTTLISALASRLVGEHRVAIVDADIGQSHIGPPTTVGWALMEEGRTDLTECEPAGMVFVGDVTPVGHLLQLTTALALGVHAASAAAQIVLIDTPGLVTGPAASALWWTAERLLRPWRIVAIRRSDELAPILAGLPRGTHHADLIEAAQGIAGKSPEQRRTYRRQQFARYFRDAQLHEIDLGKVAIRTAGPARANAPTGCLAGLANAEGIDLAVGVIESYEPSRQTMRIRAPALDPKLIRCVTIGTPYPD